MIKKLELDQNPRKEDSIMSQLKAVESEGVEVEEIDILVKKQILWKISNI